jgi:hypothetical protein
MSLRTSVEITQRFVTPAPIVEDAQNPLVLIGVNRQMVWRGNAGYYEGGQSNSPFNFPGLEAGAKVEQPSAVDEILRPHVFISNRFGVAEVSPSYNFSVDPPVYTLSPTLSATFEVSEGATGAYSSTSGKFIDANADFIIDEVAAGDVILVDGYPTFDVDAIVSDTELDVTRINKGADTWTGDLGDEDASLDRTFVDLTFDFEASGVVAGDVLTVEGWDILIQGDGIDYSVETGGVRTITGTQYDFTAAGIQPPITGPPYQVDIVWVQDADLDWVPAFKVSANVGTTTMDAVNLITSPAWPASTAEETDKVFEVFHYTQIDLTGGSLYSDSNGAYTAETGGNRTFNIGGGNPNAIDLTTLGLVPGQHSVVVHGINDAGGTTNARPIFKIVSVDSATQLTVQNWDPDRPQSSATGTGVTWEIWNDGGSPLLSSLGASITAESVPNVPAGERYMTAVNKDFEAAGVAVGDTVYSASGQAMFEVTVVGASTNPGFPGALNQYEMFIKNLVPGTPPSSWTDSNFAFYVADQTEADLTVSRVVDANNLIVRNLNAGTPPDQAFTDLKYTITAYDNLSNLDYTIEKTISGSSLAGTVLTTFTARRNVYASNPVQVNDDTWEDLLGFPVPANPLGMAARIATLNSTFPVYALQVEDDTVQSWTDAIEHLKSDLFYILVPLTQNESVLSAFRNHVDEQSTPEVKRDRIMFQNHLFERQTTRATGSTSTFNKTTTTTTVTVAEDLVAQGVIVGDLMEGTADVSGTEYDFSARIISIQSGATTILTVVNDNGIGGAPPVSGTIDDWTIKSRSLTDAEYAGEIAEYAEGIANRRIRNVFPYNIEVEFTDETDPTEQSGFYGGGDVIQQVPAYFLAAMFGAMRATEKPAQSLTKIPGTGIYRLLNPFGDFYGGNEELNDVVLDGGNWVASQAQAGGDVIAGRAVTTDTSDVLKLEDSVTVQIDNLARFLRRQMDPLLGPYNIEGSYFDIVSANVESVRTKVVDEDRDLRELDFLDIREVENLPNTIALDFDATPFVGAASMKITIYI